ncbi:MAG: LLM class flavin-dependent oxidoreductase [Promethearchaeota archaeon]
MDTDKLKIGTEGTFVPPFDKGIERVKRIEESGYDSVWWADHLMSWIPESIWTPDITQLAAFQKSPHVFFDALCTIGIAALNTEKIRLGTSVTETFRRHPAMLAQAFLTLDHASKGRAILGIGAGEGENIEPYGIEWNKPVSRLEEAIKIIKLLWKSEEKFDFNGKFWKLKDAVMGLTPYEKDKYPPIWIGAHGPKMLDLTGRLGDGWFPANLDPNSYKEGLKIIRESAKKAGRNSDEITPALWCYAVLDDDSEVCHELIETPMAKNFLLATSYHNFERFGIKHPLGEKFYGLLDFVPTRYDKETVLEAINKIPFKMCEDAFLHGTPDEMISQIEKYVKIGLKHIVICNITFFCDAVKIKSSFKCMKKIVEYFKG